MDAEHAQRTHATVLAAWLNGRADDVRKAGGSGQNYSDAADTIERLQKDNDAGRELMRQAWHEFNSIRARDGAPVGVSEEWWSQMTEELGKLLGDEAKPWMSDAAKALLEPSHAEIRGVQDWAIKLEQERDAALAEVERLKARDEKQSGMIRTIDPFSR